MELSHKVIEYKGTILSERYNKFFNPNICHVCKLRNNGNLISCDECGLMSYCTEAHKLMHYKQHVEVCTNVLYFLTVKPQNNTSRFTTWEDWIESRKILLELIRLKFEHPLKSYATEMILWSKTCLICHQQADLRTCEQCLSANYCDEHKILFLMKHTSDECNRLILLLNINISTMSYESIDVSSSFFMQITTIHVGNMLEFIASYIRNPVSHLTSIEYIIADYFSGPLTIYSGLERTNLLSILKESAQVYTIHIVVAHSSRITNRKVAKVWEILFHLIPEMRMLTIIFIGPNLEFAYSNFECCYFCKRNNKKLTCIYMPMTYYDYSQAPLGYKVPTIIVGFEAELNEYGWSHSIKLIQTQGVPLLLCSSSEQKAQNDKVAIQKILRKLIKPILDNKNYFAGVAPYRDLQLGYIYKLNQHLIIYKDLQN